MEATQVLKVETTTTIDAGEINFARSQDYGATWTKGFEITLIVNHLSVNQIPTGSERPQNRVGRAPHPAGADFLREPEVYEDSQGRRVFAAEDKYGEVAFNILARRP